MGFPTRTNAASTGIPGRAVLAVMVGWRMGAGDVSMPPSRAWSQLHSSHTFETWRWLSGTCVHSNRGGAGTLSPGPLYPQMTPPISAVGYAFRWILWQNGSGAIILAHPVSGPAHLPP